LDPALAGTSLQVDVVGANELSDLPKWQTYSVTEYWQPGNAFRRDARKATLAFGRGRPDTQSLAVDDPKWAEWLRTGALHLVLIADLPGPVSDQTGNADPAPAHPPARPGGLGSQAAEAADRGAGKWSPPDDATAALVGSAADPTFPECPRTAALHRFVS
jgi:hypothetical protein